MALAKTLFPLVACGLTFGTVLASNVPTEMRPVAEQPWLERLKAPPVASRRTYLPISAPPQDLSPHNAGYDDTSDYLPMENMRFYAVNEDMSSSAEPRPATRPDMTESWPRDVEPVTADYVVPSTTPASAPAAVVQVIRISQGPDTDVPNAQAKAKGNVPAAPAETVVASLDGNLQPAQAKPGPPAEPAIADLAAAVD